MLLVLLLLSFLFNLASATLSISYPNSNTVWYKNTTVALNWTSSDPSADTFLFQTFLSNQDTNVLSAPQQIADSTNATADYVSISPPSVEASKGYIVAFVNTTNTAQVLSKSDPFETQDGQVVNPTTSSSTGFTASSTSQYIPNGQQTSAFPSASFPSSSSGSGFPRVQDFRVTNHFIFCVLAASLGMGAVLS